VSRVPASAQPGNPEAAAAAPQAAQPPPVTSSGPNANPLDLFPQVTIAVFLTKKGNVFSAVYLTLCYRASQILVLVLLVPALWIFYATVNKYYFSLHDMCQHLH
jgi:hypothetical protein